ncbi:reverse transcriptase domain-containing protein [Tanacetum coccineum]
MLVTRQGTNDAMTPESIQAMIDQAIQRNSTNTQEDESQSLGRGVRRPVQPACVCSYIDFMKCQPLNFKGTEGVVGLSQWLEKMESVFHISGYAVENQVNFATCTLLGAALTWWNGHVRTLGHDAAYAMIWETFKKKLTNKYCPNGEIKKLEIELWNLKVLAKVGAVAYKLELPQEFSSVHSTFHVSNLKKCYSDEPLAIMLDGLHIDDKPCFVEEPVEIMDREVKQFKQSRILIVKVRWNSRRGPEFIWEREDQFQKKYPHLFTKSVPSSSVVT